MTKFDVLNNTEALDAGFPGDSGNETGTDLVGHVGQGDLGNREYNGSDVTEKVAYFFIGGGSDIGSGSAVTSDGEGPEVGRNLHDGVTDKASGAPLLYHGDNLTAHTESVAPVHIPQFAGPGMNEFINDNGVDLGNGGTSSTGPIDLGSLGSGFGSDGGHGSISGIPGLGGNGSDGSDFGNDGISSLGVPSDLGSFGHGNDGISGLGVPDDLGLGKGSISGSPGVPGGLDLSPGISGLGVPSDFDGGGIHGAAVPNNSGSIGRGGFTSSDFQNGQLTDSDDGSASGGDKVTVYDDGPTTPYTETDPASRPIGSTEGDGNWSRGADQSFSAHDSVGTADYVESDVFTGDWPMGFTGNINDTPTPSFNEFTTTNDHGKVDYVQTIKSYQPVDDSGLGAHPGTHGAEQPVDDSGTSPAHPGTHLGAVAVDAPSVGSANLATASFGGHSGAFWDAAAHSIADSQHGAVATANAPVTLASAPVAHNDSLGVFEHGATTSLAASAPVADGHTNMDALATTHIETSHVETEPSHSLGASLDLSHLASHM